MGERYNSVWFRNGELVGKDVPLGDDLGLTEEVTWAAMSHRELYDAVHTGNEPGQVHAAAMDWHALYLDIGDASRTLAERIRATESGWRGAAAWGARAPPRRRSTRRRASRRCAPRRGSAAPRRPRGTPAPRRPSRCRPLRTASRTAANARRGRPDHASPGPGRRFPGPLRCRSSARTPVR